MKGVAKVGAHLKNLGKPVNSTGNEANPSLSPDGKTLYFTRCESMDGMNKSGCTIYVSRKTVGYQVE